MANATKTTRPDIMEDYRDPNRYLPGAGIRYHVRANGTHTVSLYQGADVWDAIHKNFATVEAARDQFRIFRARLANEGYVRETK